MRSLGDRPGPARSVRALEVLVLLAALGFVAHRALAPMGETDLFFHLKIGDLIRAEHAIPFRNLFSFTFPDAPDPDLSWGFQVLVSLLYAAGGFPAIVLAKAALIVAAAALAYVASRRAGAGAGPAALAVAIALCAADQRLVERPHLVTFVGLGVLSLLLEGVTARPSRLWLVPPLAVVWANFHAGVFLCVVVLALWLLGVRLAGRSMPRHALPVLAITAAATVATPAGLRLPHYLLWHTGLGATRIIEEFRVADAYDDPWFFVMMALCLGGALRLGRAALPRVLPSLVVALLAWRSVRFVAEWAFLSTPLLALTLHAAAGVFSSRRALGAVAVALGLVGTVAIERVDRPLALGLAEDVVPFEAIRFVTEHGLRERLFHDLDVGCYLLWEGWPRYRVFQDARLPAYPDDFHRALDHLGDEDFEALLARYDVDAALINYPGVNMRAGSFDPARWALVYRAEDAMVFVRRLPRHAALIAEREIPLRVRFAFVGGARVEPLRSPPLGSAIAPCDWAARLADALEHEWQLAGALEVRLRAREAGCVVPALDRIEPR